MDLNSAAWCRICCDATSHQMVRTNVSHPYRDYFQHLLSRNVSVAVQVVHRKGPFQFLLQFSSRCHAQGTQELSEIYRAIAVRIKRTKNMLGKLENRRKLILRSASKHFIFKSKISLMRMKGRKCQFSALLQQITLLRFFLLLLLKTN